MAESKRSTENRLDQTHCVVYEYTNWDGPRIRRVNTVCTWNSDDQIAKIEKDHLEFRGSKEVWHCTYAPGMCIAFGHSVYCQLQRKDNPEWMKWSTAKVPSKRILLVIARDFKSQLYVDGHEMIRDGLDFALRETA